MSLGAFRLKKAVSGLVVLMLASIGIVSCGYSKSSYYKPPSGLSTRVLVSQGVSSTFTAGGLFIINGEKDILARASEISAGNTPGLMAISPTKATVLTYDSSTVSVQVVDARTESSTGRISLPGPTSSIVLPATTSIAYAAVPSAVFTGYPPGGISVLDLTVGTSTTIGVPNAQTVLSNDNGAQLLVFSGDSNSISVISPLVAVGPTDQGCDNPQPNPVCTVVPGFDRPVFGIISGSLAYILNCGAQCGGTQASVQVLDLSTTPPTAGAAVPVDGATTALLSGSTLYVAGTSGTPSKNACTGQTTAATKCGRLSVVDVGSMTVTSSAVITDGYHDRIDMSLDGQVFVGSRDCTNVGNVNSPGGEVRGCLSIFNPATGAVVIPPDNGDVTGLQGFTSRNVEYVVEGGTLRIYDTTKDVLQTTQIAIVGQVIDVKTIDFF
jgi:hypothetical protein